MTNIGTMITFPTHGGAVPGYLALPEAEGGPPSARPGVVVVHDAFGFGQDFRDITDRIARAGYVALTPDLYSRGAKPRCVVRAFRDLLQGHGRSVDDLLAARDYLLSRADTTDAVGIAGFCMGGGFALLLAPKGFEAAAPFYGALPRHAEQVLADSCPIVASYGRRDLALRGAGAKLEKILDRHGIVHDVKTYDGAGHSFANHLPAAPLMRVVGFAYNAEATEDAWERVFRFFATHLDSGE